MNPSPKGKRSLKDELLLLIREKKEVSFAQFTKRIPSFKGKRTLYSPKDPNIVFWTEISPEAENAILELLKEKAIKVKPTKKLVYAIDGIVLPLPLVKRQPQGGYKSPHWLPVVLNPGEGEEAFEDTLDDVDAAALRLERDRKMLSHAETLKDFVEKLDGVLCRWTMFGNKKDREAAKEATGRMLEVIRQGISLQRQFFLEKTGIELPMAPSDYIGVFDWMASANLALVKAATKTESKNAGDTKPDLAKVPISELIKQDESHTLEFKETLEYDIKTNKNSKDVLLSSLKTIAGFLNADGGTLLIGIDDSGKVKGIKQDLSTMKHSNNDRFEQRIRNCLKDRFKPRPIGKVNISFEKFTEETICRVDVHASQEIVHLDNKVYVRDGNTTQLLEGQSLTEWIRTKTERRTRRETAG